MIRKSGYRFSETIMLKQKIERDDDSKKSHPALMLVQNNILGEKMKRSIGAVVLTTGLVFAGGFFAGGFASGALAQGKLDKVVKVGSLGDQSGLYQDIGGPGSSVAAQMAIEDSGLLAKGWKIDLISATRTSPTSASISASSGSTSRRSMCSSILPARASVLRSPILRRKEMSST
jgi:hypothetical protein